LRTKYILYEIEGGYPKDFFSVSSHMVDPLSKDERNRTDGSGDMPVQSFASPPTALVDCSNQQTLVQKL
jgi:hypothetical protein